MGKGDDAESAGWSPVMRNKDIWPITFQPGSKIRKLFAVHNKK